MEPQQENQAHQVWVYSFIIFFDIIFLRKSKHTGNPIITVCFGELMTGTHYIRKWGWLTLARKTPLKMVKLKSGRLTLASLPRISFKFWKKYCCKMELGVSTFFYQNTRIYFSLVPAGPRPGTRSPASKPPTFKSTATAVRTSASLQPGRKSPAPRGTLGSTG